MFWGESNLNCLHYRMMAISMSLVLGVLIFCVDIFFIKGTSLFISRGATVNMGKNPMNFYRHLLWKQTIFTATSIELQIPLPSPSPYNTSIKRYICSSTDITFLPASLSTLKKSNPSPPLILTMATLLINNDWSLMLIEKSDASCLCLKALLLV